MQVRQLDWARPADASELPGKSRKSGRLLPPAAAGFNAMARPRARRRDTDARSVGIANAKPTPQSVGIL